MNSQKIFSRCLQLGLFSRCQSRLLYLEPTCLISGPVLSNQPEISRHYSIFSGCKLSHIRNLKNTSYHLKRSSNTFSVSTKNNSLLLKNKLFEHGAVGTQATLKNYVVEKHTLSKCNSSNKSEFISQNNSRHLSITPQGILEASPVAWQPYMRLARFDKPIGTYLLYWPCTWSIGLATEAGHLPDPKLIALFGLGAFLMRGAGCTINDMWDVEFDKKVARTKGRPLACGEITRFQALVFLAAQLSLSLCVLLQLNWYSIVLGASSLSLVVSYPLMKRFTYWPQAFLGLTFNWGALLGWSAVSGYCDWHIAVPLYMTGIAWTLLYDTIYAHQDKDDDLLIGVKSTALKFGEMTPYWLSAFGTTMVGGLIYVGMLCDQTWPYYVGVSVVAAHIANQIWSLDMNNVDDCANKFRSNKNLGFILFLAIMAGTLMKDSDTTQTEETEPHQS